MQAREKITASRNMKQNLHLLAEVMTAYDFFVLVARHGHLGPRSEPALRAMPEDLACPGAGSLISDSRLGAARRLAHGSQVSRSAA